VAEESNLEKLRIEKALDENDIMRDTTEAVTTYEIDRKDCSIPIDETAVILFFILIFLLLFY